MARRKKQTTEYETQIEESGTEETSGETTTEETTVDETSSGKDGSEETTVDETSSGKDGSEETTADETVVTASSTVDNDELSGTARVVDNYMSEYVKYMDTKAHTDKATQAKHQNRLLSSMQTTLRSEGSEFRAGMDKLVSYIRAYRDTIFSESHAYRAVDQMRGSRGEKELFRFFLTLLMLTADVNSPKQALEKFSMNSLLNHIPSNEQQQRLQDYYS